MGSLRLDCGTRSILACTRSAVLFEIAAAGSDGGQRLGVGRVNPPRLPPASPYGSGWHQIRCRKISNRLLSHARGKVLRLPAKSNLKERDWTVATLYKPHCVPFPGGLPNYVCTTIRT